MAGAWDAVAVKGLVGAIVDTVKGWIVWVDKTGEDVAV